ncbi:trehalose-phosphatase [Brevundimonas sp. Root1279]|uniref:trehalose-phosphatase n=1 Tax=Brevundimonas sp. Root1279 TaxID=1736443 RepID=UPI0009EB56E7|nr:trehalose-phosphatase [Brevundimonas sp. Root1279]
MGTSDLIIDAADAAADTPTRLPAPPPSLPRPALFLDLDGVLAELAETPDAVVPHPRRTAVLKGLIPRLDGRVAIISGRTIAEIDRIAEDSMASASGVHGLERRRADGSFLRAEASETVRHAIAAFEDFARTRPGVTVEDKAVAAGLHYRGAPDAAPAAEALVHRLAAETGLSVQPGNMVIELKTPGASKGTALKAFMAEAPFAGATPVMLGDDLTDEDGFKAAAELGGFGVLVGPPRETAARFALPDVDAVLAWLETLQECE